ncbi:MAG: HD domain-containing protein [bacterium]
MNSSPTSLTSERARAWQRLLAAKPPAWVAAHCRAVEGLAVAMGDAAERRGLEPDRSRLQQGALLHDIGRSVTQDVHHASVGARLLREDHWDEAVVRIVERHTGGGIDATDARDLGIPVKDYTPRSLEERIVCHADNLFSGERRLHMAELGDKYRAKNLPAAWAKIQALHAALCDELGVDLETLPAVALPEP